jgi:hypothetical protein
MLAAREMFEVEAVIVFWSASDMLSEGKISSRVR